MEVLKIKIPEDISDITLDQFQRYEKLKQRDDLNELDFNKRVISIFTNLKYMDVGKIPHKDYTSILDDIVNAMNKESKFVNRFKIKDVEFGFVPNLDEMSTAEFVDLEKYKDVEDYHRLMAILFRPITSKDKFGNYKIASYDGTKEYNMVMKQMPMNVVNGAFVFFLNLAKELRIYTQRYTMEVQQKVAKLKTILENGDGIPAS